MTNDPFLKPSMDILPAHPTLALRRSDRSARAREDGAEPLPAAPHAQTHFDARPSIAQTLAIRAGDA